MIGELIYRHETLQYETPSSMSRLLLSRKRLAYLSHLWGEVRCELLDVCIAMVDQGGNVVKAFECLLVPVIICTAYRSSSLVSMFIHSTVTNDALKDVQPEMDTKVLQANRRDDTRYVCALARLLAKSSQFV